MVKVIAVAAIASLMAIGASDLRAQRGSARDGGNTNGSTNFNYNDISKRSTARSERDDRKTKEAEEAKKKAEEEKRRAEREKRGATDAQNRTGQKPATTMTSSRSSTGTKTAASGKAGAKTAGGNKATQPVNTGGTDPTAREVTEVMLEAVQTQKVVFDVEAAKSDPNIILLNPPKFDPTKRTRAGDASGIAAPL